jgi:hypothetical protein
MFSDLLMLCDAKVEDHEDVHHNVSIIFRMYHDAHTFKVWNL